jgi:gliding motility-associated-like protein/CSLREA domain-containing protein
MPAIFRAVALLILALPLAVSAQYVVDTPADMPDANPGDGICSTTSGDCSLRAAVEEATASGAAATISVPADSYAITEGHLVISTEVEITGASARTTFLDATGNSRHFRVTATGSLTIQDVELLNGFRSGNHGGAIKNDGILDMLDVSVRSCSVFGTNATPSYGGAIYNGSVATINAVTFQDCHSTGGSGNSGAGGGGGGCGAGGAIAHWYGASLDLVNCTITGCSATGGAGGNANNATNNGGSGAAGIASFGGGGDGGDVSWNNADGGNGGLGGGGGGGAEDTSWGGGDGDGGTGVYAGTGGSTSGTTGGGGGGGAGLGGALFSRSGAVSLSHCTIYGNSTQGGAGGTSPFGPAGGDDGTGRGAGILVYTGTVTIDQSVVYANSAEAGMDEDIFVASGTVTSDLGHNALGEIGTTTLDGTTTGNLLGTDPLLGVFGNNGGPTDTFSPLPCDPVSPLIDAGVASAVTTDQRGVLRDALPDIGSVEGPPPVDIAIGDTTLCPGETWLVEVTWPDADFTWQDGSTGSNFLVEGAGTYTVTVEANGCSEDFSTTVDLVDITPPDFGPDTTICPGQFVTLDAENPGAIYAWSNATWGQTTLIVDSGEVHVLLQIETCIVSDTIHIGLFESYPLELGLPQTLCEGGSVDLDALDPGWLGLVPDFLWGDATIGSVNSATAAGMYGVIATTAEGCTVSDAVEIIVSPLTAVDLGQDSTICPGTALVLDTGYPMADVVWQDGSTGSTTEVTSTGIYTANVSMDGCFAMDQVFVQVVTPFEASLPTDAVFCDGDSALVYGLFGAADYVWQDGVTGNQRWINIPGLYTLESVYNGCSNYDEVMVSALPNPEFSLGPDIVLCAGDDIVLNAPAIPDANVLFMDALATNELGVDAAGLYWAQVTVDGCQWSDTVAVSVADVPIFNLPADTLLCPDDVLEVHVDLHEDILVQWDNGVVSHDITMYQPGQYVATAQIGSCVHRDTIEVDIADPFSISLESDYELCNGETLELEALQGPGVYPTTYIWDHGSFAHKIEVSHGGTYRVVLRNVCDTTEHVVAVEPVICGCQIYVPNAFTPDNDGKNDNFKPVLDCEVDEYTFTVFDRWGRTVFVSNDVNVGWYGQVDGTIGSKTKESGNYFAIDGVYLWEIVTKRYPDGFPKIDRLNGYVHIVR